MSKSSGLWERFEDAAHDNGQQMTRIANDAIESLEAAEKRIAELEARTVKLPAEKFCPAEYIGSQLWSEAEAWNKAITACADAIRAAGVAVEGE